MRKLATLVALGFCTLATAALAITPQATLDDHDADLSGGDGSNTNDCPAPVVYDNGMFDEYTPPTGCSTAGSAGCFVLAENPDGAPAQWRKLATPVAANGEVISHAKIWGRYNASGEDSGRRVHGFCVRIYEAPDPIYCPDGSLPGEDAIGTIVYDNYANVFTELKVTTGLSRNYNYCITLPVPFATQAGKTYWYTFSADYDLVDWNGLGQAVTQWFHRAYPGLGFAPCEASAYFCDDDVTCDPWNAISTVFGLTCWIGWEQSLVLYGTTPVLEGACCFEDGSCQVSSAAQCGGTYQGDGTVCDPNPCPPPASMGGCCFGTDCFVLTQGDCEGGGGSYQGDNSACDPNPCVPNPTKTTTWGGLKKANR